MKRQSFWIDAAVSLLFVILMLAASAVHLRHLVRQQTQVMVRGLQKSTTPLLEKANHAKDDLALQGIVQSLAEVPGIATACVIDLDSKILAHTQPSQIGQRLHSDGRTLWAASLHEGATKWGTLIFTYSDRALQKRSLSQMELEGGLAVIGWILFLIYITRLRRKADALREQVDGLTLLGDEHQRKMARLRTQSDELRRLSDERLKQLCETLPYPAAVLDHRQWIVAVNQKMLERSGAQQASEWIERSWQDVTTLQACGPTIQQSLHTTAVAHEIHAPSLHWRIRSFGDSSGAPVGTLVTLVE